MPRKHLFAQLPPRYSIGVSQNNLAMMLGISRPTLNKELQALAEMGAISLHYGQIEIKNIQLLIARLLRRRGLSKTERSPVGDRYRCRLRRLVSANRDRRSHSFKTALGAHLASELNLEVELKNIVLLAFRFFEFLHNQGQKRYLAAC